MVSALLFTDSIQRKQVSPKVEIIIWDGPTDQRPCYFGVKCRRFIFQFLCSYTQQVKVSVHKFVPWTLRLESAVTAA